MHGHWWGLLENFLRFHRGLYTHLHAYNKITKDYTWVFISQYKLEKETSEEHLNKD